MKNNFGTGAEVFPLFPTPLYTITLNRPFHNTEIECFSDVLKHLRANTGNRSSVSSLVLDDERLSDLKKWFEKCLYDFKSDEKKVIWGLLKTGLFIAEFNNIFDNSLSQIKIRPDNKQTIISITNCSSVDQYPKLNKKYSKWKNIINPKIKSLNKTFKLKPFETMWLSNK